LDRLFGAYMHTDSAIAALGRINPDALIFFVKYQGRALKMIDAVFTAITVIRYFDLDTAPGWVRVQPVDQAAMSCNHHGRAVFSAVHHRLSYKGNKGVQLIGVGSADKIHTTAFYQFFDINRHQGFTADPPAAGRRGLVPGHGRGPVIQNHQDKMDILGNRIYQGRKSGMEKSGISDGGNDVRPFGLIFIGMIKAGCVADGGTHAQYRVNGSQIYTQGVTSDVTGINCTGGRFF